MCPQMLDGTAYPLTWEEYERSVIRSTEDPEEVIGFRPGAWIKHVRQFLSGADDDGAFEEDCLESMTIWG